MKHKILVVDDEPNVRIFFEELLEEADYKIKTAGDGAAAIKNAQDFLPEIVFLDLNLPDANGLELIKPLKKIESHPQIIIISALGTVENAVRATQLGAYDFITKPFDIDKIERVLTRSLEYQNLYKENLMLRQIQQECPLYQEFIGESPQIERIKSRILKLKNTDVPILITGETGTGKNILAKQIHYTINEPSSPMVYINCSNISENLFESELFGHEKGAFTGAVGQKRGRIEEAGGGTVILDEISEIPYSIQAKLLTFIQEKTFFRVGGSKELRVETRIIALTNRDLEKEIEAGGFRKDLFYRLNVIHFHLPPLRERRDDIVLLCRHFLDLFHAGYGGVRKELDSVGFEYFRNYSWPGNARELKNQIERAYIYSDGETLVVDEILSAGEFSKSGSSRGLREQLQAVEKQIIVDTLSSEHGNRKKTAETLRISLRNLQYKIAEYGIDM
ncbi:MAG: sigma-54 dependent transcriptional regulator [Spirochaetales bacterium]|uniref:Sigma-54 dependent transcriptional regulator n=1 Tax=Candidatus Thalassospirochaeta sargassi TaxID=3119039 RepID=A0AAJ1IJG4_9SPIO|nr:sigma-54 dependent transcriptional regulator [Spirochaetales bacterium]